MICISYIHWFVGPLEFGRSCWKTNGLVHMNYITVFVLWGPHYVPHASVNFSPNSEIIDSSSNQKRFFESRDSNPGLFIRRQEQTKYHVFYSKTQQYCSRNNIVINKFLYTGWSTVICIACWGGTVGRRDGIMGVTYRGGC